MHASQCDIAVVLLARGLIEELVEEEERKDVGIVEQVVGGASEALDNKVGEVGVGSAWQAFCEELRHLIGVLRNLRDDCCSTGRERGN